MSTHTVSWTIDVEAESIKEAAEEALAIQRDPNSEAIYFIVYDHKSGAEEAIDLLEE